MKELKRQVRNQALPPATAGKLPSRQWQACLLRRPYGFHLRFRLFAMALLVLPLLVCGGCGFDKLGEFIEAVRTGKAVSADKGVLFFCCDQLVYPQEEITLTASLQSPKSLNGIKGATITFYYNGQEIGSDQTDKYGKAHTRWRAPAPGNYEIEVRPTALPKDVDEDYRDACKTSATLLVQACQKECEFVVVDLDLTLVADDWFKMITQEEAKSIKDSAEVMSKIAGRYCVMYLTHRPDELARKSKRFLEQHGFPQGVLITCPWNESFQHSGPSKYACLRAVKQTFPNLRIGIGDKASDVKAYLDNGLEAYMIPHYADNAKAMRDAARAVRDLPAKEHVQVVRSWQEIQEGILEGKQFPPDEFVKWLEAKAAKKNW